MTRLFNIFLSLINNKVIIRYGVVGVIGTITHVGITIILVELLHISPTVSTSIAFSCVLLISYILNRHWTFEKTDGKHLSDFIKYSSVSLLGLSLNAGIMHYTVSALQNWYIYGLAAAALIVPVTNFILNKYWVFKK